MAQVWRGQMQHPAGPDALYGNLVQGELVPIGCDETDATRHDRGDHRRQGRSAATEAAELLICDPRSADCRPQRSLFDNPDSREPRG